MCGTYPATRTFIRVNVARVVDQRNRKIAGATRNGFYLTICDQVYVQVLADLDQFRRNNSHGTIIGGESLVEPGHQAANGWRPFHQMDVIIRIGQIK